MTGTTIRSHREQNNLLKGQFTNPAHVSDYNCAKCAISGKDWQLMENMKRGFTPDDEGIFYFFMMVLDHWIFIYL